MNKNTSTLEESRLREGLDVYLCHMWHWLKELPRQWEKALAYRVESLPERAYAQIVTIGMGGSAFGAEVAASWSQAHSPVPWLILRDYTLPKWVGPQTLVIAASYSGTTEETLAATKEALERDCVVVGLASGGTLAAWAEARQLSAFLLLPNGYAPRAAVPYAIGAQLAIAEAARLIPPTWRSEGQLLFEALRGAKHPNFTQLQTLAEAWADRLIAIYAPEPYAPIALRARQQIQENAKHLAWHHVLPEMNHNELVGLEHPTLAERLAVLFLTGPQAHPRHLLRLNFLKNVLETRQIPYATLEAPASLPHLAAMLWLLHAVDILSVYLAQKHGVDPIPVPIIDQLKHYLAQKT